MGHRMTIGERIKEIRGSELQGDFASKLGLSKNTISRWERGVRIPDANNLAKILNTYPWVNPAWLLTGEGEMGRKVAETPSCLQELDNERFLSDAQFIDHYLDSKYYINIPAKNRGLIYAAFHERKKNNDVFMVHRVVSDLISKFYIESFCLHDYKITSLINNLVEEKFKTSSNQGDKNVYYWEIFDYLADTFCDKKSVAPVSVETQIESWLKNEIKKYK